MFKLAKGVVVPMPKLLTTYKVVMEVVAIILVEEAETSSAILERLVQEIILVALSVSPKTP